MQAAAELVWLLAAVAHGDAAAFERLYAATRAKLYGVALRILRREDLSDEVVQETYLKVWRSAGSFDPQRASPITWMVAILRNTALDHLRKRGEASIEDEPEAEHAADEPRDPLARRILTEELRRLLACLGALDEEQRRMLLLAYYNGWSRGQLARHFQRPVNTVKTWLRRGLLQVRECLDA